MIQINGSVVDPQGNSYFILNGRNGFEPIEYNTYAYSAGGSFLWTAYDPTGNGGSKVLGLAVDTKSAVVVTGQNAHYPPLPSCGTYKIDTNGNYLWAKLYPLGWAGSSVGTSVTVDKANNWYVTGYSPTTNTSEDIVTIAYDTNGKQLWLQRYDGSAHGDDEANAIALDGSGNIYVAGYETVAGGGTEMALIKYSPVILQHQSNGNFLLQAQGASGEPFDIQATTNLQTWLDLGTDYADTNGLLQYLDTNASHFPWRFYLAIPQ